MRTRALDENQTLNRSSRSEKRKLALCHVASAIKFQARIAKAKNPVAQREPRLRKGVEFQINREGVRAERENEALCNADNVKRQRKRRRAPSGSAESKTGRGKKARLHVCTLISARGSARVRVRRGRGGGRERRRPSASTRRRPLKKRGREGER